MACLRLFAQPVALDEETPPEYVSRAWRTQDGLPENRVRALAQTPDGYLWVGTTGGLARFDGVRFVTFTRFNTPAITEDNIRALTVARDGSLWAATDGGGLVHLKDGKFTTYGFNHGLTSEFVASVVEDSSGAIWAATNRGLFRSVAGPRFVRVDPQTTGAGQAFFSLWVDTEGRILAGGQRGLWIYGKDGNLQRTDAAERPAEVFRVRQSRGGTIWLSTNRSVLTQGGKTLADLRPLAGKGIAALTEDRAGNVWVGTLGNGVYFYRNGNGNALRVPALLADSSVLSILEDREGTIWAGTADGLMRLTAPDVAVLDHRDGIANDNVTTAYCSVSGEVWLTTVTGDIYRYSEAGVRPFRLPAPAADLRFLGVFQEPSGAYWFGTDSQGAVRLDNGVARLFTMREGLRNNGIQFIHASRDGKIWIGTTSGVSRWDGSKLQHYYTDAGLAYGWVRSILEEPSGDILIGTDRGISRFHDERFVADAAFQKLARDKVWSIHRDSKGYLWLGTRNAGLVRVFGDEVRRITTKEGLLSNSIFQVIGGADDRLWFSGPVGISSASLSALHAAAEGRAAPGAVLASRLGGGRESVQSSGGVQPAGCMTPMGEIWIPSVKGAIHFHSRRPPIRKHTPVRVEGVVVDGSATHAAEGRVNVGPGRRRIRIDFTSCSLRTPEAVSFRYKLDGYDPQWNPVDGPRSAEYDNLPPGQYTFRVVAQSESPEDKVSSADVVLVIEPHFYQTGWFYALVGLGVVAALAGVFLLRERRARQEYHLRLEERTRIAREMHDTLVQGCVGVSTLIEAAVGSARSDQEQMLECLDNARIHLRLTLDEARQALADLRHDSFRGGLAGALEDLTKAMSAEKGIPIPLRIEGTPVALEETTSVALLLVAREAIRNATMHASATCIEVSLLYGGTAIELDVQDDGRGFSPSTEHLASYGHFGILGMRERMEQIGGTLEVSSAPGEGATISARLPLARNHTERRLDPIQG